MSICFRENCGCDMDIIKNELADVNKETKTIKYCPTCGQMLYQECPHDCDEILFVDFLTESCPKCKREIVFCKDCGRINDGSRFQCIENDCGNSIKTISDVFLANGVNHQRTNIYSAKKRTTTITEPININAKFSKAVIGGGSIYYWKEFGQNDVKLTSYNIAYTINSNKLGEEEFGAVGNIKLADIENIEIFNHYIVTSGKQKIFINSTSGKELIKEININDFSNRTITVKEYKCAIIGDNKLVIMFLDSNNKQSVVYFDVNDRDNAIKYVENSICEKKVEVRASPVINEDAVYFAGYDGNIYKIICNTTKELTADKIIVEYPAELSNASFCVSQIFLDNTLYLTGYSDAKTYLFQARTNSAQSAQCVCLSSSSRLTNNKISFYKDYLYMFDKAMSNKDGIGLYQVLSYDISERNLTTSKGENFGKVSIRNYYIISLEDTLYVLHMESATTSNVFKFYCQEIDNASNFNKFAEIMISDDSEFLIYQNFAIICDHDNNKVIIKDITFKDSKN